jgi:hypothetical protein
MQLAPQVPWTPTACKYWTHSDICSQQSCLRPPSDETDPKTDTSASRRMEACPERTVSLPFLQQRNMFLLHRLTLQ